jgi:alpha-galactosidase
MHNTAESVAFDTYFKLSEIAPPRAPKTTGWTSWYYYYNKIDQEIIQKNLDAFATRNIPIDIFQIDDGWQTHIGDWHTHKTASFPKGMQFTAQQIHQKGYKAGLWLAPFVVETASDMYKSKPQWLLRDTSGKPVKAGYSPLWSGNFYALDTYNPEFREYLAGVFYTVLHKWKYDLVKLDFLYAACILPRHNKTTGQVMHDSMDFLRSLIGDKLLLACGVPLASAFGLADYCRIGADIHLSWEHKLLKFLRNRERVSTILSLRTTLGRWQLNGRAFQNDPDVFILRKDMHKLSSKQQMTVLVVNALLGSLLFTSDFIGDYDDLTLEQYTMIFYFQKCEVCSVVEIKKDFYELEFVDEKANKQDIFVNLSNDVCQFMDIKVDAFDTTFVLQQNKIARLSQP